MQHEKTATEILNELFELQNYKNAKDIMLIDKDGKLIDFNNVFMVDATDWTDDDIEEIERNPKQAYKIAVRLIFK